MKTTCPHCQSKINLNLDVCPKCNKKIDNHQLRSLLLAVRVNNIDKIITRASKLLENNPDNIYGKYYYAYGKYVNGDKKFLNEFLDNNYPYNDELENIIFHMIRYDRFIETSKIIKYLNNKISKEKREYFIKILQNDNIIDDKIPLELINSIKLPEAKVPKQYLINALILISIGLILMITLKLILLNNISKETIYFSTVISFYIPSIFIAMGITRLVAKKGNFFTSMLFFVIVIIISTWIFLLPYQQGIFNHINKVIKAPYDFIINIFKNLQIPRM